MRWWSILLRIIRCTVRHKLSSAGSQAVYEYLCRQYLSLSSVRTPIVQYKYTIMIAKDRTHSLIRTCTAVQQYLWCVIKHNECALRPPRIHAVDINGHDNCLSISLLLLCKLTVEHIFVCAQNNKLSTLCATNKSFISVMCVSAEYNTFHGIYFPDVFFGD